MTDPNPPSEHEEQQQEKWYERTPYQVLLFAGGIVLFVLVGGWLLDWYINPKTSGQKKDLVQALGLITAGVAGAVGIYFTWRGQRLTQRGHDENQRNTQEQLRLTREGQITERFTTAIDQLGHEERTEIRLGGIYALERIAKESEEDHWPIMEILTYYVRGLGPHTAAQVHPVAQAIMTVIKRRSRHYRHGESEPLDLQATSLQGTNLREAHLEKVNLRGANLQGAHLEGAHLMRADLQGAYLEEAQLTRADLRLANLRTANLREANLEGARLEVAHFQGAQLHGANLQKAGLGGARLQDASGVTQEQLEQAFGNEHTQLPRDLEPPAHWDVRADGQPEGD